METRHILEKAVFLPEGETWTDRESMIKLSKCWGIHFYIQNNILASNTLSSGDVKKKAIPEALFGITLLIFTSRETDLNNLDSRETELDQESILKE